MMLIWGTGVMIITRLRLRSVRPPAKMPHVPTKRRKPCYDLNAVGEPYFDEIVRREVEFFPEITFGVEPTTHCHLVTEWMRGALVRERTVCQVPLRRNRTSVRLRAG